MTARCQYGKRSGHTLLEIMIVVGLIGAAGAIAVLNLREQMPTYQLDSATTQLVNDLTSARMRAISQTLPAKVSFNTVAQTYSVWIDANTNGVVDTGESDERSLAHVPDLDFKVSSGALTFTAHGHMPTVNHYWISKLGIRTAGQHFVYVLPSGQVRATRGNLDWSTGSD